MSAILLCGLFFSSLTLSPKIAYADAPCGCRCLPFDCGLAAAVIVAAHALGESLIIGHFDLEMTLHRRWMIDTFFRQELGQAMARMTEQMSAVAMQQVMIIGAFLDAKHQMETQRLFQTLEAQAYKDYQPSEDFCWFGTNTRALAHSEARSRYNAVAFGQRALERQLGNVNLASAVNQDEDKLSRWNRFRTVHCDVKDNNWQGANSGLEAACAGGATDKNRVNRDMDYTRLIEEPRTLQVDFTNGGLPANGEEEDVMALADNIYGHDTLSRQANASFLRNEQAQHLYLNLRSVAAKRSVAENSFGAIVGLKSEGTAANGQTREYLASIMKELGMPDDEIYAFMGENPSYYAQLEILAKRIYQNPDFYAQLYDKPANVERKAAALSAIDLMLERAMYESQMRREAVISVLLSSKLRSVFRDANSGLSGMSN